MTSALVIGSSSLIASSVIQRLLRDHDTVYATYSSTPPPPSSSDRIIYLPLDITSISDIAAIIDSIYLSNHHLNTLVYTASYLAPSEPLVLQPIDEITRSIGVNLTGAIYTSSYVTQCHINSLSSQTLSIVLIGSEAGTFGGNNIPIYAS